MQLYGLKITAGTSAFVSMVVVGIVMAGIGLIVFQFDLATSILGALLVIVIHWTGELWHQLGHAWAARRTGYPMIGVHLWTVLGVSIYPKDEPALTGKIHIQRALGGPLFSFIAGLIGAILAVLLPASLTLPYILLVWFTIEHLGIFAAGAFLPLGFTDGSTILRYWGK